MMNLAFAGSRGSYKGGFTTPVEIVRDDVKIDSGSDDIQNRQDISIGKGFQIVWILLIGEKIWQQHGPASLSAEGNTKLKMSAFTKGKGER